MTRRPPTTRYALPGRHPLLPRPGRRVAARGDDDHRGADPLRLRPRRGAAGGRRAAGRPGPARRPARRRPQKNAWVLLAEVAPELAEWAAFFAAGAGKRAAAEAGSTRAVTEREADDLVRDADRFLALVEQSLGLAPHAPVAAAPGRPAGPGRPVA